MDELHDLVALSVPAGCSVLAVAPDAPLLKRLAERGCRTWSIVADDGPALSLRSLSEDVVVGDIDRTEPTAAFPDIDFDAVVLMGALSSVVFPAELLRRITKVLPADGVLVASVPNATHASRRVRLLQGVGQAEEASPGRPLLRAYTGRQIDELLSENGLGTVDKVRLRRPPTEGALQSVLLPPEILGFLEADDDADTDHYVVIASPAAGPDVPSASLAEAFQAKLREAEDLLAERRADLTTLEEELEALKLDLAIKDDFALELRGKLQTAEGRADRIESELSDARASLDRAEHRISEQAQELDDLRRRAGRGVALLLLDRMSRRLTARATPPAGGQERH